MTWPRAVAVFRVRVVGLALVCLVLSMAAASASAAPPYLKFLQGLRDRRYDDTALDYLERLADDPNVPADVKDVLDYERAVTLIAMARAGSDPGTQAKRLDEATASLEKFINTHPDHPLVARAQSERGDILVGKARVSILQADSPGNEGKAEQFRTEARDQIAKAREIFENARARYEEQWKSFGPFVDAEDEARRDERNAALNALIQARLHLAECTYREAQTYPAGGAKRNGLLDAAAKLYEQVHSDYRSQIGGLYARLWMAKCYEEQAPRPEEGKELTGEASKDARQKLNIAEAIYSELLEHDTKGSASATRMQEYAFWFKLIVRNHPVLADHQLVIDQATEWLKPRVGAAAQTTAALGVRWERAQAAEKLAARRDLPEADRGRLLRAALDDADFVNAYPGEYRDVSRAMIGRLKSALGKNTVDPQDFDEASGLASTLHNGIGAKQEAVKAAKTPADKAAAEQALAAHLDETARILRLALSFAGPGDDRQALNRTRYRLAFVEYNRDRPFDAAVLGEYVGRKFKDESPSVALDAAYLAMAAYFKLYAAAPDAESKAFEIGKLRETADFIAAAFPDSEQANEARMMLGRIFLEEADYAQAAEWFSKVPEASAQALDARLLAGRSFWDAYAQALGKPEGERPDQATLDRLKGDAEKFLRDGLAMAAKQIPQDAVPPDDVLAAKVTLAQIVNLDGKYQEAVDLVTGGTQSVVKLVAVEDPAKRPKTGVTSAAFASLAHQQLLRAYIGLQQVDPAIAEMRELERIGGEGNTAVFVQLGRQIKAELEALPVGPDRDAVMSAFDQFLGKIAEMKQGQTYGSLLWIGETYFGLAEAAADPKRSQYFDQAAASYDDILSRANEPGFLPTPEAVNGVRLRLAAVEKSRGEFGRAYDLAKQVLKAAPKALNAQVETATILRDWGLSGRAEAPQKLLLAIQGDNADRSAAVWGWNQIARKIQQALTLASGDDSAEQREILLQARYEIPSIRRAYAKTKSDRKQLDEELDKAEKELLAFVATNRRDEIGDVWWDKLDALYGDIQRDRGVAVVKPLQPAKQYVAAVAPSADAGPRRGVAKAPAAPGPKEVPTPAESSFLSYLLGGLVVVLAVAGAAFMTFKGNRKPRPNLTDLASAGLPEPTFTGFGTNPDRPAAAKAVRPAKPAARPAEAAPLVEPTRPAEPVKAAERPRPAETPTPAERPKAVEKPKPAAPPKPEAAAPPKPSAPAGPGTAAPRPESSAKPAAEPKPRPAPPSGEPIPIPGKAARRVKPGEGPGKTP